MTKNTVQIVGAGMMGASIAACAALAGHWTVLIDSSADRTSEGITKAQANIEQLRTAGLAADGPARDAKTRLLAGADVRTDMADTFLIIEAIFENMDEKRRLFRDLDEVAPPDVLIASNTSGMRISDIAGDTQHPERTATAHFWFPGHLVPLVEVVMGEHTTEDTAFRIRDILKTWGKAPVIVRRDLPGQLANRILQAIIREAVSIVDSGLADAEDVDTAVKLGMGLRFPAWGPLEHIDAVGLDLACSVQKDVLPGLNNEPEPSKLLVDLVARGDIGKKSGKGIYDWSVKDFESLAQRRDAFIIGALKLIRESEQL